MRSVLLGLALLLCGFIAMDCRAEPLLGCNEEQLTQTQDALVRGAIDEHEAVERLSQACPRVPPSLLNSLRFSYTWGLPSAGSRSPALGEEWRTTRLRGRTCADSERWGRLHDKLDRAQRMEAMYEVCELARYGLLETDEVFFSEDLPAFFLTEYMRGIRVDEQVVRAFARALMTAALHGERARRRCRLNSGSAACLVVARAEGLTLPRAHGGRISWGEGTSMLITPKAVALDDGPVLSLEGGRFVAADLKGSVVAPLQARLEAVLARKREADDDRPAYMLLRADHNTRYDTLMQALFTAGGAGMSKFGLLVRDEESVDVGFMPLRGVLRGFLRRSEGGVRKSIHDRSKFLEIARALRVPWRPYRVQKKPALQPRSGQGSRASAAMPVSRPRLRDDVVDQERGSLGHAPAHARPRPRARGLRPVNLPPSSGHLSKQNERRRPDGEEQEEHRNRGCRARGTW